MDALITDIILVWLIDQLFFFCVFFFFGSAASICACVHFEVLIISVVSNLISIHSKFQGFIFVCFFIPPPVTDGSHVQQEQNQWDKCLSLEYRGFISLENPRLVKLHLQTKKGKKCLGTLSSLIRINYTSRYWRYMKCCSLLFGMERETIFCCEIKRSQ